MSKDSNYCSEDFRTFVDACEIKRVEDLGKKFLADSEHSELVGHQDKLYNQLKALIPKEYQSLLNEYSDACLHVMSEKSYFFYRQGLVDMLALTDLGLIDPH